MNYYRRYSGDYLRDTSRLTIVEHGAYCLLLDYYYSDERPLPADFEEVCRMIRAIKTDERRAVEKVLSLYFVVSDDGYHNSRADDEISKAAPLIEAARENGKKGGRRKNPPDNPPANPPGSVDGTETGTELELTGLPNGLPNGQHPPTTILQPPSSNHQPPTTNHQPTSKTARASRSADAVKILTGLGSDEQNAKDWLAARKGSPLTKAVVESLVREAGKAGISVAAAVKVAAENSWRGFKASWLTERKGNGHETVHDHNQRALEEFKARLRTIEGENLGPK